MRLTNFGKQALCVLVEPLGEDFWIASGQTLRFNVADNEPQVSWYEEGASVWVNSGSGYDAVVTTDTGDVVECGYQRPPNWP